jgi:hypothetical protein
MEPSLDNIAYHLTSTKTKPNITMREEILPFFEGQGLCVRDILDFGCGRYMRDSLLLTKNGFHVDAVELEEQIKRIDSRKAKRINNLSTEIMHGNYDATLLNFVIQVLPTQEQRNEILEKVRSAVKYDGYFVLSVRNQNDWRHLVKPKGRPFNDGFLMEKNNAYTFVKLYEKKEVETILDSLELKVLDIFSTSDSYIALAQK